MARDEEPALKVRSMGRRRAACLVKNGKPGIAACWLAMASIWQSVT